MPGAEEIRERYEQAKLRSEKKTGFILMVSGAIGSFLTGIAFRGLYNNGVFSLAVLSLVLVCLFVTLTGFSAWRSGGNALKEIEDNVRGPLRPWSVLTVKFRLKP